MKQSLNMVLATAVVLATFVMVSAQTNNMIYTTVAYCSPQNYLSLAIVVINPSEVNSDCSPQPQYTIVTSLETNVTNCAPFNLAETAFDVTTHQAVFTDYYNEFLAVVDYEQATITLYHQQQQYGWRMFAFANNKLYGLATTPNTHGLFLVTQNVPSGSQHIVGAIPYRGASNTMSPFISSNSLIALVQNGMNNKACDAGQSNLACLAVINLNNAAISWTEPVSVDMQWVGSFDQQNHTIGVMNVDADICVSTYAMYNVSLSGFIYAGCLAPLNDASIYLRGQTYLTEDQMFFTANSLPSSPGPGILMWSTSTGELVLFSNLCGIEKVMGDSVYVWNLYVGPSLSSL